MYILHITSTAMLANREDQPMKREFTWTHETARFLIALHIEPEEMDPADSFERDDDIEAVRNGEVEWFSASVEVYGPEGELLGRDTLGGCAYDSVRQFYTEHRCADPMNRNCSIMREARGSNVVICHYFPDMVRNAISEARKAIASRRDTYQHIHD
jgi:hypothetical protein